MLVTMKFRLLLLALSAVLQLSAQTTSVSVAHFETNVLPVLRTNCLACHSAKTLTSGLSLQSRDSIVRGGNRGSDPKLILEAIKQAGDLKMPPGRKLKDEQIAAIEKWVMDGLPMPENMQKEKRQGAGHWSFQSPKKAPLPAVRNSAWLKNEIDHFVLAKLEAAKLKPSPEAARSTLLRRVSLDVIGLPPTAAELDAFLNDKSPQAYDRAVDRLLASPHYGERWGRNWLDIARYADSDGYTIDAPRDIWKYRDWVINATNNDMPFDQFTLEQLAGDLLPNATVDQKIATGFHRNTPSNFEGGIDFEQYRVEAVADRVMTTGSAFLGLTIGCARCHDHKFDPISQREFYQFFAFFNNINEVDKEADRKFFNRPFLELGKPEEVARKAAVQAQLEVLDAELAAYRKDITDKDDVGVKERTANLRVLRQRTPNIVSTLVMEELPQPRPSYIHLGGDFLRKGAPVVPGVLGVLNPMKASAGRANRVDLARWLVDRDNPLTARVTVNRMWQRYFGKGFVETESDFGTQGDKPTNQELLDWLAVNFMENDWSQKKLHKLIVTSATYRQASEFREDAAAIDPENRLLARQNRVRLDAEIIRDASLVSSGLLSAKIGGPSVYPPQPPGVYQVTQVRREWKTSTGEDRFRRGMYTFFQRSAPHPSLVVFDAPDASVTCTRRIRSNTPLQALTQLNDSGATEWAAALGKRLMADEKADDTARIRLGYNLALNREPRAAESGRMIRFVKTQRDSGRDPWPAAARVLLNLDEFLTRP